MIVRDLSEAKVVSDGNWTSRRLVLAGDKVGFSFHITEISAMSESTFEYKNHIECVYCISGNGSIEDLATGEVYDIHPGVMYLLNDNDRHVLRGGSEPLVLACVFNPPITGNEIHDKDGSYSLPEA